MTFLPEKIMNTEWWNDESSVEAFMAGASCVCTAARLPGAEQCWVVSEATYDPPDCRWSHSVSCPNYALATAVVQEESLRADAWRRMLQSTSPADWLSRLGRPDDKDDKQGAVNSPIVVDRAVALALCAFSFPAVEKRSYRQGITAIHAGKDRLTAFLIFQKRVCGLFEHDSRVSMDQLLNDLREFRLGWLPNELVRLQGGYGAVLAGDMPPQAEGFVPTFVFGPRKSLLAEYGKLLDPPMDEGCAECRGLLYGLAVAANIRRHL